MPSAPSAVDLLRPAVRAMPGYTPGEQISDLVKLNTNEGAFPPSPRVMAALAAIADETLRLYPDPVSARLRAAAAARFGVHRRPDPGGQRLRRLPDHPVPRLPRRRATRSPARGRRTASTTRWRRCRARSWCASPFQQSGRRWELPPELGAPAREDDHPREPQQPVGDAGPGRRAAPAVRRRRRARSSSSTRPTSTSRWARAIDASMLPYLRAAPEPGRAAHDVEELQPGGRAPGPAVRGGAARRRS